MSFWNTSDGKSVQSSGEFDAGGGDFEVIPNNTQALAIIEEAQWVTFEGNRHISLRWSILKPEAYENRKIFQKLHVNGDPRAKNSDAKADKAKQMLAAIDKNCGGKLAASEYEPDDEDLASALLNKPMMIKIMVWSMKDTQTGDEKKGNWIGGVAPRPKAGPKPSNAPATAPKPAAKPASKAEENDGGYTVDADDLPF